VGEDAAAAAAAAGAAIDVRWLCCQGLGWGCPHRVGMDSEATAPAGVAIGC